MIISGEFSDQAVIQELGQRIARYRLNQNMTQEVLAVEAGVSKPTIQRIEKGASSQIVNVIRILRALKLLENIDSMVPEPTVSPIQQIKMQGKIRRRASGTAIREPKVKWSWKD
jgi:putative transcriptional regulator